MRGNGGRDPGWQPRKLGAVVVGAILASSAGCFPDYDLHKFVGTEDGSLEEDAEDERTPEHVDDVGPDLDRPDDGPDDGRDDGPDGMDVDARGDEAEGVDARDGVDDGDRAEAGPGTFTFPNSTDTALLAHEPDMCSVGDYYEGARVTTLPSATRVSFTLHAARNGLTCDVLRLRVRVNALVVGTFSLAGGEESSDESFAFAAISGPTFVIRLEVPGSVSGGCGSVELALDTSPWRLE